MGYSIRTDRYRYTEWREFDTGKILARELYDHKTDARETLNMAGRTEFTDTLSDLAQQLSKMID